jgi:hypothetical protein
VSASRCTAGPPLGILEHRETEAHQKWTNDRLALGFELQERADDVLLLDAVGGGEHALEGGLSRDFAAIDVDQALRECLRHHRLATLSRSRFAMQLRAHRAEDRIPSGSQGRPRRRARQRGMTRARERHSAPAAVAEHACFAQARVTTSCRSRARGAYGVGDRGHSGGAVPDAGNRAASRDRPGRPVGARVDAPVSPGARRPGLRRRTRAAPWLHGGAQGIEPSSAKVRE